MNNYHYLVRKYGFETQVMCGDSAYEEIYLGQIDLPFFVLFPGNLIEVPDHGRMRIFEVSISPLDHRVEISVYRTTSIQGRGK